VVTWIERFGGRCAACGRRFCAVAPAGMAPGSPFGASIRSLLLYLHHSHHVGFERLSRMMGELFGLKISEGAIANAFRRTQSAMPVACAAIKTKLLAARVIASDETTSRIDGTSHWPWGFVSAKAVLHTIARRRAKAVAEEVLGTHRPQVGISDRYAGQQDLASGLPRPCPARRPVRDRLRRSGVRAPAARVVALGDPYRPATRCPAADDAAGLPRPCRTPP
jgi:transposase